jgi:hypothetical protein
LFLNITNEDVCAPEIGMLPVDGFLPAYFEAPAGIYAKFVTTVRKTAAALECAWVGARTPANRVLGQHR